jgi:hypothetical protein
VALQLPEEVVAEAGVRVREEPLAQVDYRQAQDYQKWQRSRTG